MKKNMLNGICAAAVCFAVSSFASNSAQAASVSSNDKAVSSHYFQDSTNRRGGQSGQSGQSGRNNRGNRDRMNSGKMNSDSTGRMGNMKGKSSGGYKNKGTGKSKMDTTRTQ